MQRPYSARSDGSDEADGTAEQEAELARLQKEIRNLENDKHAYGVESQNNIRMRKMHIARLERENDELTKNLKVIESQTNQKENEKQSGNLEELGRQKKEVEKQIEEEREKQKVLDAQIREAERKIQKEREKESDRGSKQRQSGGSRGESADRGGSQKQRNEDKRKIRKLEDQLQLANNKFGKALEANKELRQLIDNLRVERQRFDNLYKKLDKEKQDLQQETNDIMDQSTQSYDQRVEAQEKMVLLREKAEKDIQQHNAEMKELIRIIDHDYKLREFMNTKGKDRDEDKQLVTWRERKEAMTAEKKKASQTDTVESYDEAFSRIKRITGTDENDIDRIVNKFIQDEDQNFALFNFVNDQNNKIEVLQEQIEQIRNDIRDFQGQGVKLESNREMILKQLEERQTKASKQADGHDSRYKELGKVIDQLKSGISSLFNNTGCDRSAIDDMLGASDGITDKNMLQYLGLIEERANELLLAQSYLLKQNDYDLHAKHSTSLLGEGPHPQHSTPSVYPPAVGDEFEDDDGSGSDTENRPLTMDELMEKALKSVRKRENTSKKHGHQYELSESHEKSKKKDKHVKSMKAIKA